MNQFKPIFLGTVASTDDLSKLKRAVDTQKVLLTVLLTSYNRLENLSADYSQSVSVPVASTTYAPLDHDPNFCPSVANKVLDRILTMLEKTVTTT